MLVRGGMWNLKGTRGNGQYLAVCVRAREREKASDGGNEGRESQKMVVWGLGRGESDSLFIWSVTGRPSELDREENLVKKSAK